MKKIIIGFLVIFTSITSVFAYNPTIKDEKALNNIYSKIDLIGSKNSEKVLKLGQQIETLKGKYTNNEKIYYLLSQIEEYINEKYNRFEYDFIKVLDGDTISINYNGEERKVRLIGINAPETKNVSYNTNCLGIETKKFLIKKLENISKIKIEFDLSQGKTDSFGRLLGYLYLSGTNINKLLLNEGLASEYTYSKNKPYKYQKEFIEANNIAKENKIGIYSDICNLDTNSTNNTNTGSNVNNENKSYSFYTSSHYTSKLYYCETDSDWENLSKSYLKNFDTEEDLLKIYPYKKLNKPCN